MKNDIAHIVKWSTNWNWKQLSQFLSHWNKWLSICKLLNLLLDMQKKDDYPSSLVIDFLICTEDKRKSGNNFGNVNAKLLFCCYLVVVQYICSRPQAGWIHGEFEGENAGLAARSFGWSSHGEAASSAAVSLASSISWQRKGRGTPRNSACCLWD